MNLFFVYFNKSNEQVIKVLYYIIKKKAIYEDPRRWVWEVRKNYFSFFCVFSCNTWQKIILWVDELIKIQRTGFSFAPYKAINN